MAAPARTGLSSPIQFSRHSGNSVLCARSWPSTKRFIRTPAQVAQESYPRITQAAASSHSQGQNPPTCSARVCLLPPDADIGPRGSRLVKPFHSGWNHPMTNLRIAMISRRRSGKGADGPAARPLNAFDRLTSRCTARKCLRKSIAPTPQHAPKSHRRIQKRPPTRVPHRRE